MTSLASPIEWFLGIILLLSSLGVLIARKPVHASLSFLLTLLTLASFYVHFSAEFIAVMQVIVYAGAILVIFMFIIVLFQDAHQQLDQFKPKSRIALLSIALAIFLVALMLFSRYLIGVVPVNPNISPSYGTVETIGRALYIDFFFPFEIITVLFLVAIVGALYIGKKEIR